jgi:hypothetical protein
MANGSLTGLTCNTLYHFRATATNSTGTATGADAIFTTAACVAVASPSGTRVPAAASVTDSSLAVWTIVSGQILRNGVASGGYGSQILWFQNVIYVLGADGSWWQWTGSAWTLSGTTDPSVTPVPSPSGTRVPTAASVTDNSLAVWTIVSGQALRNGVASGGYGSQILWFQSAIYVLANGNWYQWTGSNWTLSGPTDPSVAPSASPSGTRVPSAPSITDNSLAVWTIGAGQQILKGGQGTGGYGSQILWFQSTLYVLGTDGNWYQWTGSDWTFFGSSAPV